MDSGAVSDQVDKILRSQSFATKGQLRRLLELLHKNMESQSALTTELVISELWPAEIKTKQSRDVATEMNRLRRAVDSYYNLEGENDQIVICFPNRAQIVNGYQETRWIEAKVRNGAEGRKSAPSLSRETSDGQVAELIAETVDGRLSRNIVTLVLTASACVSIVVVIFVLLRVPKSSPQPYSARVDGTVLRILDENGKELWSKSFPQGFGHHWYYADDTGPRIWFKDLQGKGRISVLFAYSPPNSQSPPSSTLICYSDRGTEEWRWTPGRNLPELKGSPPVFMIVALEVLKATAQNPSRIVVASNNPWWPAQIAILNPAGEVMSEYWHSGNLRDMVVADFGGNGREEILLTGSDNGYDHQATLVVLDPDKVSGASTEVQPEFQIHNVGVARENLRLLFPRSDLNRAGLFTHSYASQPAVRGGRLRLLVEECPGIGGCSIRYEFDRNFHLITAFSGDEFRNAHDRFYARDKSGHTLDAEEQQSFLKVRCLVGCNSEFVTVAQSYDPADSFEKGWNTRRNPNGVWSYGYSSGFTNPVILYDKTVQNGVNGGNAQYWLSSSNHVNTAPAAEFNRGPSFDDGNVDFLENEFLLVAGTGGQYSDLIFTAPSDGEYSIAGNFRGAQYGIGTVVGLVANGKVLFSSKLTSIGQFTPFGLSLNLKAGDNLLFAVGPGSGFQNTGLSLTVTRTCASTDHPTSTPEGQITCSPSPKAIQVAAKRDVQRLR